MDASDPFGASSRRAEEDQIRLRKEAAARWPVLLEEIRKVPGFERFALPPLMSELHQAAAGGTVVALLVTEWGCGALFLTGAAADYLPLPDLTAQGAAEHANAFLHAVNPSSGSRVDTATVTEVLEWLWDAVTGPVLDKLGHTSTLTSPAVGGRWPRVWWIPTGALTVLPIHAAGHHDDPAPSRRAVLDRAVSSYTPSVRALGTARSAPTHPAGSRGFALGINEIKDLPPLGRAEAEAEATATTLGVKPLIGLEATRDAVLTGLPDAVWAHFACHGLANQDDPSRSFLALADGPLYAAELFTAQPTQPYLAYLSACTTAMGAVRLLDENISLAAAFQLAGFPHVIGTLWTIDDFVAEDLAHDLYHAVHPDQATWHSPGLVLHDTVRAYRNRFHGAAHLWASHIHYGP